MLDIDLIGQFFEILYEVRIIEGEDLAVFTVSRSQLFEIVIYFGF